MLSQHRSTFKFRCAELRNTLCDRQNLIMRVKKSEKKFINTNSHTNSDLRQFSIKW